MTQCGKVQVACMLSEATTALLEYAIYFVYCFSMAAVVMEMCHSVSLHTHCLSCHTFLACSQNMFVYSYNKTNYVH